jgi:urease accessory protein
MMKKILVFVLCLAALPATAAGFAAGLAHPFMGLDHLLAMLGIGIWSRRQEQPLALPLTFIAMMAFGALLQAGVVVAEGWILASVVAIGLLLVVARLPKWGAVALVALFALLHGQVHGHELPGLASAAGYLLSSGTLLIMGIMIGSTLALRVMPRIATILARRR